MIVANPSTGRVVLASGLKDVSNVTFDVHGMPDSVHVLGDEWNNSRNLAKMLRQGTIVEVNRLIEYPDPPQSYHELSNWARSRVRRIVLGTDDEFDQYAMFTPYSNSARMPEVLDVQYIRNTLIPLLVVAQQWFKELVEASGESMYKKRLKAVTSRVEELREIASENS